MRVAPVLALLLTALPALAADVEATFRDGFEGYGGTEDFMMYAPSSVAFVNYGVSPTLTAGINRWGERYTSVLRFDVGAVPAGAKVTGARLVLHATSKDYPSRDLAVQLHQLTAANADWIEGSGDGTREPLAGTPCWSFRKHDSAPWAGEPGALKADVDFSTEWRAEATVPARHVGPVTFELPAAAVQAWIEDPRTNAGLHLWPQGAADKGDVAYFASAQAQDVATRPTLLLSVESTPEVIAALNRARADRLVAEAEVRYEAAVAGARSYGDPPRAAAALAQAHTRLRLLKAALGSAGPAGGGPTADLVAEAEAFGQQVDRIVRDLPRAAAAAANQARGLKTDFALGTQPAMVQVFRRDRPFSGDFAPSVSVSLARNEHEAVQIVVVPVDKSLRNVTWELRGLNAHGVTTTVAPVGYVRSKVPALTTPTAPSEWWPDPLLDFKSTCDVPVEQVQPLWVDIHAAPHARPGVLEGELIVRATACEPKSIRIRAQVHDFTLPTQQHLKTIWGMAEANFSKFYKDSYNEAFAWKYFDMFLDHRMAAADLYRTMPTGVEGEDSIYHLASVEALEKLKARGSGWWNVGYVLAPEHVAGGKRPGLPGDYDEYLRKCVEMFAAEMERVKAAEWPADRVGIYFLDETSDFEALGKAAGVMKDAFPDVPLMTTGYDRSYGLEDTLHSRSLDIWVPLTPRYGEDRAKIEQGRRLGKQGWWYICCAPIGSRDLNWFTQYPAIRARLLMGVAARKYQVDGFLYYRTCGWANNPRPIPADTDIFTDWVPQYAGTLPDGDGQIVCAGPAGPLATIRLENIRDGAEDYEYYWLLENLVAQADAARLATPDRRRVDEARGLLQVPDAVLTSITQYTQDPQVLLRQRDRIAAAIVELQEMLGERQMAGPLGLR